MTNHVHLLASPHATDAVSNMMQAIGRRYVRYFNREYRRSGTLWEGRFKSSYRCHALGKRVQMSTPHIEYLSLGKTDSIRQDAYRKLFLAHVDDKLIKDIRSAVNKGMALGSERFKDEIEGLCSRRVRPGKMGRPRLHPENE
jgi:putative transposase